VDALQGGKPTVTSDAPQTWFVMLQDEASAGRLVVPLRPFLRFSRKMDNQLGRLERRIVKSIPQLKRRHVEGGRMSNL
jgi:hypothetical protein